jgi:trypsin-like peptidase
MKRFLALLVVLALLFPLNLGSVQSPKGFAGKLWASTFALYGTKNERTHFLCTAEPIEKTANGYRLLTAGHCVQEVSADVKFSVAEEIGGTQTPITLVKAYLGANIDFALFDLQTTKTYSVFVLGDESKTRVGDKTINPNFSLGIGKQLSLGKISSLSTVSSDACAVGECAGDIIVQEYAGAGASGSAVLSAKTHKVIGLLVWEFEKGQVGFGVEPISFFAKFMAGPNQPHPGLAAALAVLPPDVFAANFGEKNTFMLTVHGPNPVFAQSGYTFQADTDGLELSDEYYYNVPVFIGQDEDGYRLVSTKDGYSVAVTVLGKI